MHTHVHSLTNTPLPCLQQEEKMQGKQEKQTKPGEQVPVYQLNAGIRILFVLLRVSARVSLSVRHLICNCCRRWIFRGEMAWGSRAAATTTVTTEENVKLTSQRPHEQRCSLHPMGISASRRQRSEPASHRSTGKCAPSILSITYTARCMSLPFIGTGLSGTEVCTEEDKRRRTEEFTS